MFYKSNFSYKDTHYFYYKQCGKYEYRRLHWFVKFRKSLWLCRIKLHNTICRICHVPETYLPFVLLNSTFSPFRALQSSPPLSLVYFTTLVLLCTHLVVAFHSHIPMALWHIFDHPFTSINLAKTLCVVICC